MNQASFGQDEGCEDRIGLSELDIGLDDSVISAQLLSGPLEFARYLLVDGDITGSPEQTDLAPYPFLASRDLHAERTN
jgi:hypothetical protein